MADMMTFPNTVEEFMEKYKITDTEQIYTNGAELVPIFRMKQWFDHSSEHKKGKWLFSPDHKEGICTSCNFKIYGRPYNNTYLIVPYNYCPNCGARMEEENDE